MAKVTEIKVDRNLCIGAAPCILIAPGAFDLDKENIAVVKDGALKLPVEKLLMAAQACPVKAITLIDEKGKQLYPKK